MSVVAGALCRFVDELKLSLLVFLTEQVGMCASVKHQQLQFVAYLLPYQQPVGTYMAFPLALAVAVEHVRQVDQIPILLKNSSLLA